MSMISSNRALVIVDSDFDQHVVADEVMLPVLNFWGVPYDRLDLARLPDKQPDPSKIALIVILQEGIPADRISPIQQILSVALASGAGVVNCDPGLQFEVTAEGGQCRQTQRPWRQVTPVRTAVVADTEHFITRMQRSLRSFQFRKPVASLPGVQGPDSVTILADSAGTPLLDVITRPIRMANWKLSSWVWSQDFHGFARGMDALLWRSLLWAARKPFAIAAFPPYGRFRFDDCRGLWRTPDDFRFLDVMEEFGEVPNLCVCLSSLTSDGWRYLGQKAMAGTIEVTPHVLEPDVGIFNVAEEASRHVGMDPLAGRIKGLFERHCCPMARSISDHNHEISTRGIRIARALKLVGRMNVMRAGERWETLHTRWRPAPFGTMHYALDRFADAPDIYTAINHHASFSDSFIDLGNDRFLCTPFGGFTEDRWDFLNGCVDGPNGKDLDRALERLLKHAELALTSLFFLGSISHTHFASQLTKEDWRHLLKGYRSFVGAFGYEPRPYDEIVAHAMKRHGGSEAPADLVEKESGQPYLVVEEGATGPHERWHNMSAPKQ